MKTTTAHAPYQAAILERIRRKGHIFATDHQTNLSVNALERKKLVKCSVHTTPSGQRIRKVEIAGPQCVTLPEGTLVAYIEMNGRTYYIDDSTGEAIMDSWTPGEEEDTP